MFVRDCVLIVSLCCCMFTLTYISYSFLVVVGLEACYAVYDELLWTDEMYVNHILAKMC